MGNSEVGHQNIGAGRIVDQEATASPSRSATASSTTTSIIDAVDARQKLDGIFTSSASSPTPASTACSRHLYACLELCNAAA